MAVVVRLGSIIGGGTGASLRNNVDSRTCEHGLPSGDARPLRVAGGDSKVSGRPLVIRGPPDRDGRFGLEPLRMRAWRPLEKGVSDLDFVEPTDAVRVDRPQLIGTGNEIRPPLPAIECRPQGWRRHGNQDQRMRGRQRAAALA
ncbi:MAG: hypothetical protein ACE5I3_14835 [Phycisphaerae bacterium]